MWLTNLTKLEKLDLRRNKITTIPAEITKLVNLTSLDLNSNQISTIPAEITKLVNLTSLDLNSNQITTIPTEIAKLVNLTSLDLNSNQISVIPPEIGNLTKLQDFRFNKNENQPELLPELRIKWIENLNSKLSETQDENKKLKDRLDLYVDLNNSKFKSIDEFDFSKSRFKSTYIRSTVKAYFVAVEFIDEVLAKIDIVSKRFSNEIEISQKLAQNFGKLKGKLPKFDKIIIDISTNSNFSFDDLRGKLLKFKSEAETKINEIRDFSTLSQFHDIKEFDFYFFAETIEQFYNQKVAKLEDFAKTINDYEISLNFIKELIKERDIFENVLKKEFVSTCEEEGIYENQAEELIAEWQYFREQASDYIYNFLELQTANKIDGETVSEGLKELKNYRDEINNIFIKNRIKIVQTCSKYAKAKLIEDFERDLAIYLLLKKLEKNMIEIIISKHQQANKKNFELVSFLANNRQGYLKTNISMLISKDISVQIKQEFEKFEETIFNQIKTELEEYSKRYEKLDEEYDRLMFKMSQELKKMGLI